MKQRSLFWDNFKGILIFLVVFGHFIYTYAIKLPDSMAAYVYNFIYSFHMPAFIFCSGYFSRSERSRSGEALLKLLLSYLLFNTLMLFFTRFYMGTSVKILTPYYSYWYLLSLIAWRFLAGKLGNIRGILALSVMISLMMGCSKEFTNLLSIRRTVAFFPFFVAGYRMDREKVDRFLERRKPWQMILSGIGVLAVALIAARVVNIFDPTESMLVMGTYSQSVHLYFRIAVFAVSAVAIAGMFLTVPNCEIPLISKSGRNSLLIYLVHRFITIVYYRELFPYGTYGWRYLLYAFAAAIVCCWLLGGDGLNRKFTAAVDSAAASIIRGDSRGQKLLALIILGFLGILLLAGWTLRNA